MCGTSGKKQYVRSMNLGRRRVLAATKNTTEPKQHSTKPNETKKKLNQIKLILIDY